MMSYFGLKIYAEEKFLFEAIYYKDNIVVSSFNMKVCGLRRILPLTTDIKICVKPVIDVTEPIHVDFRTSWIKITNMHLAL